MSIRKPTTLGRKPVDIRCLNFGRAITTQIAVAEIISKDQNDIGGSVVSARS